MIRRKASLFRAAIFLVLLAGLPAPALTINLTYDSSVNSLSNAAQFKAATNYAAQQLQNDFSDNITVNITVATASGTGTFGLSEYGLYGPYTYAQARTALINNSKTANEPIAVAHLPSSDPTSGGEFFVPFAEAKALGLTGASATIDGTFTFGSGYNWNLNTANRAVSGKYDFVGLAEHELSEVMGRVYGLGTNFVAGQKGYLIYDLFRFSAAGTRSLVAGSNNYFSIDNGTTHLKTYNFPSGDPQDWASGSNDACNAFSSSGVVNDFTTVDITAMDVMGYTASSSTLATDTPTLPPWALVLLAAALVLVSARFLPPSRSSS